MEILEETISKKNLRFSRRKIVEIRQGKETFHRDHRRTRRRSKFCEEQTNSSAASPVYLFLFFLCIRWKNHIIISISTPRGFNRQGFYRRRTFPPGEGGRGREADDDASRTSAARRLNLAARVPHDFTARRVVCAGLDAPCVPRLLHPSPLATPSLNVNPFRLAVQLADTD